MLVFDVPDRPYFARDTETGEIFGVTGTPEIETVKAIRIVDGVERSVYLGRGGVLGGCRGRYLFNRLCV